MKARSPQKQKGDRVKVKIKAGDDTFELEPVAKSADAGQTKKLVLKPKQKSASARIIEFLDTGRQAKAKVKVLFTDGLGNTLTQKVKVKLKG